MNSVSTNNIAPNVSKSDPSAALTTPVLVRSQHKTPPPEPPLAQDRKTRACANNQPIGINQLVKVNCEGKRQLYCRLCKKRLLNSSHPSSAEHQLNYVKLREPGWTAEESEHSEEFDKVVAKLAEEDKKDKKNVVSESIRVKLDVYQELAALPQEIAVHRVLELSKQRNSRNSPSSTDPGETRRQSISASPSDFASPDFEMDSPLYEITGLSTNNQTERGNKCELKTVSVHKAELRVESPSTTPDPLTTRVVPDRPRIQTPDTGTETSVHGRKQENNDPILLDALVSIATPKETPSSNSIPFHAVVRSPTPSQTAEHGLSLSGCSPGQPEAFSAPETIRIAEMDSGPSNLSKSLSVNVTEPFIGLCPIWECRGRGLQSLTTIYLCECCELMLFNSEICQHVISTEHQLKYLLSQSGYLKFMFWLDDEELIDYRAELVKYVVSLLRERESSMDAQIVLLDVTYYDYICKTSFRKALKLVRSIQRKKKLNVPIRPDVTLPSQNASAHTAPPLPPDSTESTQRAEGNLPEPAHIHKQPQQAATLPVVQTNTVPGTSVWLVPSAQPQQLFWVNTTQTVVVNNTVYAVTPTAQFNPPVIVPPQYAYILGQSNSSTQPAVPAPTPPRSFHNQQ